MKNQVELKENDNYMDDKNHLIGELELEVPYTVKGGKSERPPQHVRVNEVQELRRRKVDISAIINVNIILKPSFF